MSIGLIRLITTQKVLKTCSVKGMKQHYLGSNHCIGHTSNKVDYKFRYHSHRD